MIMPAPFSQKHNGYLRNYVTSGVAHVLDQQRELMALHKERFVFPVKAAITKARGGRGAWRGVAEGCPGAGTPSPLCSFLCDSADLPPPLSHTHTHTISSPPPPHPHQHKSNN